MIPSRYWMSSAMMLLLAVCHGPAARTQVMPASKQAISPQEFFDGIVRNYDPANPPKFDDLLKVQHDIEGMPETEVSLILPSIFAALSHRDDNVKTFAVAALFSTVLRPDSAALLSSRIESISALFALPSARLQGSAVHILAMQRPHPGREVIGPLLGFLKQTDRDPLAQADSMTALLQIAPDNPAVLSEAYHFLSRPLDVQAREAALNAIANSKTEAARLTDAVIEALNDTSQEVRFTAAQALWRMPRDVIVRAEPALQQLIGRPDEAQEVKAAAREAVRAINQEK